MHKFPLAYTILGLVMGVLVALPLTWYIQAPKHVPAPAKINQSLNVKQVQARFDLDHITQDQVQQPSAATGGMTCVLYQGAETDPNNQPYWVVQACFK